MCVFFIKKVLKTSLKAVCETRFNTVATHFESVLENVAPQDNNDVLEKKFAEKKKSALLQNIEIPLLKEITRHLLQYQRQCAKLSASNSPTIQLVYPAFIVSLKACQIKPTGL